MGSGVRFVLGARACTIFTSVLTPTSGICSRTGHQIGPTISLGFSLLKEIMMMTTSTALALGVLATKPGILDAFVINPGPHLQHRSSGQNALSRR